MKKMMNKNKWMMLVIVLLLAGCGKEETLEESVDARWQAIVDKDLTKAYGYLSPGYKEVESLDSYKVRIATALLNIQWNQGNFESVSCVEEDVCEVLVGLNYSYKFSKRSLGGVENINTKIKEDWVKLDDKWYHVPKNN